MANDGMIVMVRRFWKFTLVPRKFTLKSASYFTKASLERNSNWNVDREGKRSNENNMEGKKTYTCMNSPKDCGHLSSPSRSQHMHTPCIHR